MAYDAQNVAPPHHQAVREANRQEHRHPARVEPTAEPARHRPVHLNREAHAEEGREDGDELPRHQPVDHGLRHAIRHPGPHQMHLEIGEEGSVEATHVGDQDAQQGGPAKAVDDRDPLVAGHRTDSLVGATVSIGCGSG